MTESLGSEKGPPGNSEGSSVAFPWEKLLLMSPMGSVDLRVWLALSALPGLGSMVSVSDSWLLELSPLLCNLGYKRGPTVAL